MLKYPFFKHQQSPKGYQQHGPPRICVDSCPTSNLTSHVCWDEDSASTVRSPRAHAVSQLEITTMVGWGWMVGWLVGSWLLGR